MVEATKRAFSLRDQYISDPVDMEIDGQPLLEDARLDALAADIRLDRAAPCGAGKGPGDTIWMGVVGPALIDELVRRGHQVDILLPFDETMGHAGAIVRPADGVLLGAADPRSDGAVAAW